MKTKVLVVSKDIQPGMEILAGLGLESINVVIVDQVVQAIKNVKKYNYDLIILGDRLKDGTTYDVGLSIKTGAKNSHVPVICTGKHVGRTYKLLKLLGSRGIKNDDYAVEKVRSYLGREEE